MTNTKPTWEEEFDKEFMFNCDRPKYDLPCGDVKYSIHQGYLEEVKNFIQKVERDAYERGYKDGEENKYPLIEREITQEEKEKSIKEAVEMLSSKIPCEGCYKCEDKF